MGGSLEHVKARRAETRERCSSGRSGAERRGGFNLGGGTVGEMGLWMSGTHKATTGKNSILKVFEKTQFLPLDTHVSASADQPQ